MKLRLETLNTTTVTRQQKDHGNNNGTATSSVTNNAFLWRYRGWFVTMIYLLPSLISTVIVVDVRDQAQSSNDRHNRQLLEQGLRGGIEQYPSSNAYQSSASNSNNDIPAASSSNITIPMHAHSGTHHVHLYIGSPPQRQTLIVDTGSKAMAFPCKTCKKCGECCGSHASPYFDPSLSTTHRIPKCGSCLLKGISQCPMFGGEYCTFSQKYTEGSSWTATEVEDMVWLGSNDIGESLEIYMPNIAVAYPFGCQTSSKGLFRKQYADGILGLSIHDTSVVTALYQEGLILRNAFSLCFTQEGGSMSLGGTLDQKKYHTEPMAMTPVTRQHEHGYYSVEVIRLIVGDTIITDIDTRSHLLKDMNSGKGCILDSGTTDSFFPASLARVVRKVVMEYSSNNNNNKNNAENADTNRDLFSTKLRHHTYSYIEFEQILPVVSVVFANNVTIDILPQNYMEHVPIDPATGRVLPWEGSRILTNRLYFEESGGSVLGANAFSGYDILFDSTTQGQHQVGIAPADCHSAVSHSSSSSSSSSSS